MSTQSQPFKNQTTDAVQHNQSFPTPEREPDYSSQSSDTNSPGAFRPPSPTPSLQRQLDSLYNEIRLSSTLRLENNQYRPQISNINDCSAFVTLSSPVPPESSSSVPSSPEEDSHSERYWMTADGELWEDVNQVMQRGLPRRKKRRRGRRSELSEARGDDNEEDDRREKTWWLVFGGSLLVVLGFVGYGAWVDARSVSG
ncbi:unnamed protein product [Periconia digitata]|uniref:Uncharacterized protein n=1 Tax=Periconia digitata TaxID=1303443 RepID=A0A9W4U922_9PLEO|nr:unnamed protein product [Periconia digitata]